MLGELVRTPWVLNTTTYQTMTNVLQHCETSEGEVPHQQSAPIATRGTITVTLNSDKHHCTMIIGTPELSARHPSKPRFRVATVKVVIHYTGQKQVLQ